MSSLNGSYKRRQRNGYGGVNEWFSLPWKTRIKRLSLESTSNWVAMPLQATPVAGASGFWKPNWVRRELPPFSDSLKSDGDANPPALVTTIWLTLGALDPVPLFALPKAIGFMGLVGSNRIDTPLAAAAAVANADVTVPKSTPYAANTVVVAAVPGGVVLELELGVLRPITIAGPVLFPLSVEGNRMSSR